MPKESNGMKRATIESDIKEAISSLTKVEKLLRSVLKKLDKVDLMKGGVKNG